MNVIAVKCISRKLEPKPSPASSSLSEEVKPQQQRAYRCSANVLLGTLITIALTLLAAAGAHLYLLRTINLQAAQVRSRREKQQAKSQSIRTLSARTSGPHFQCSSGQHGQSGVIRCLCALHGVRNAELSSRKLISDAEHRAADTFPLIDYNSLLSRARLCPTAPAAGIIPGLTPGSGVSALRCTRLSSTAGERLQGNLLLTSDTILTGAKDSDGALTLAASGYIYSGARLTIRQHALIAAGGDLFISKLSADGDEQLEITLLSATGAVSLQSISGQAALRVISWKKASIAPQAKLYANTVLPPLREVIPLGFTSADLCSRASSSAKAR